MDRADHTMTRARRPGVAVGLAAVVAGLAVSNAGGVDATASHSTASGWWRGTITATEQWDVISGNGDGNAGSATLRITRTAPARAQYEVQYSAQQTYAGCARWKESASWSGEGPLDVRDPAPDATGVGMSLKLRDPTTKKPVSFDVLVERQSCDGVVTTSETVTRNVVFVTFRTGAKTTFENGRTGKQVIRVPSPEAKAAYAGFVGLFFNPHLEKGGGTTEISWNLTLVPTTKTGAPTVGSGALQVGAAKVTRQPSPGAGSVTVTVKFSRGGQLLTRPPYFGLDYPPVCRASVVGDSGRPVAVAAGVIPDKVAKLRSSSAVCRIFLSGRTQRGKLLQGTMILTDKTKVYKRPFSARL